jgi:WW domain-binding protein 4
MPGMQKSHAKNGCDRDLADVTSTTMSEYWVSKKKYFCKYCDIYIADDAPSRQQHENGLRHKGNVERFVRGIYKAGEKHKKDLEEEQREMRRVEQASSSKNSVF